MDSKPQAALSQEPGRPGTASLPQVGIAAALLRLFRSTLARDWSAPAFVWGVWALTLLTTLAFVKQHGHNVPYVDEFVEMVPAVTGERPVTLAWLWSQHSGGEHRLPLPRLIYVTLSRLAGIDLRAVMLFNVTALAALAFAMVWCARSQRGQTVYADAFFPLAVVGLGHYQNLIWSFQVQFILSTTLAGTFLLFIIRTGRSQLTLARAMLAGACLVLLPLCGVNGVLFVPPFVLWVGYASFHWYVAGPTGKRNTLVLLALASAALLLTGFYFVDYKASDYGRQVDLLASSLIALQFLTTGPGLPQNPLGLELWPYSGIGIAAVLLLSLGVLGVALWRHPPPERARALGLLLFLAGVLGLAAGVGWGRAGEEPHYGLTDRYVTPSVPVLCCAYFVWSVYGSPAAGRLVQMCLFVVMCGTSTCTAREVFKVAKDFSDIRNSFKADLMAGVPRRKLAQMYGLNQLLWDTDLVADRLRMLREAGAEPYRHLQEGPLPPFLEVEGSSAPAAVHGLSWQEGSGRTTGDDAHAVFALPETLSVCGIRVKFSNSLPEGASVNFRVRWRRNDQDGFGKDQTFTVEYSAEMEEKSVVIWVYDKIDEYHILPSDMPCEFHISGVMLLLPEAGPK